MCSATTSIFKRCASAFAVLLFAISPLVPGQIPFSQFNLQVDDQPGIGSQSGVVGPMPGSSGPVAVDFDLTWPESTNDRGYITFERHPTILPQHVLADLRLVGRDRLLNATITLLRDATLPGIITTTNPSGDFPAGSTATLSLPVLISVQGGGLGVGMPPAGLLTLTGSFYPGFHHNVALFTGGIDTLPGVSVSMLVKQDFFPPGIPWRYIVDRQNSSAVRASSMVSEQVIGRVVLVRDPLDHRIYTLGPVDLLLAFPPSFPITAAPMLGGTITLDPYSRTLSGTISWTVGGVPVTRVLDGVGDSFSGSALWPAAIQINESGLAQIQSLSLQLRRTEIVSNGPLPALGQPFQPILRGDPGSNYIIAATLDAAPGFNTPVGDILVELDLLSFFSLDPQNGIFNDMIGVVPPDGDQSLLIYIPNSPGLSGLEFFLGGATFHPTSGDVMAVTNALRITL